ncbi:hypothetical protein Anapl_16135 [Anas platyrhynchos]|uniref:Uncharacterized protein n=1 Tax=Anas platyrhynchos TaxID=8839 RepID=R0LLQ7_ANAPL|nr:hypothetical protein Anapl_16135 [Anas platyrhynchos]
MEGWVELGHQRKPKEQQADMEPCFSPSGSPGALQSKCSSSTDLQRRVCNVALGNWRVFGQSCREKEQETQEEEHLMEEKKKKKQEEKKKKEGAQKKAAEQKTKDYFNAFPELLEMVAHTLRILHDYLKCLFNQLTLRADFPRGAEQNLDRACSGGHVIVPRHCPLGVADLEPCAPPAVAAACSRSGGGMLKWRWVILAWSVWTLVQRVPGVMWSLDIPTASVPDTDTECVSVEAIQDGNGGILIHDLDFEIRGLMYAIQFPFINQAMVVRLFLEERCPTMGTGSALVKVLRCHMDVGGLL